MTQQPIDKTVPYSTEMEEAALGCALIDPLDAIPKLVRILGKEGEPFYLQKHKWIYKAIVDTFEEHGSADWLLLVRLLEDRGQLEAVGGATYVSQLINIVPSAVSVTTYAKKIHKYYIQRSALNGVSEIAKLAYKDDLPTAELISQSRAIVEKTAALDHAAWVQPVVNPADEVATLTSWSIPMGVDPFDDILRLVSQKIHIFVGSPGSGKTTIAIQSALENAMNGVPSHVIFSETDTLDARFQVLTSYMDTKSWQLSNMQYDPNERTPAKIDWLRKKWDQWVPNNLPLYFHDLRGKTMQDVLDTISNIPQHSYVLIDHAYAFAFQSEQRKSETWTQFITFFSKILTTSIKRDFVTLVFNQYTQAGVADWLNPHSGFGGASNFHIACTLIHTVYDSDLDIAKVWKGLRFKVQKSKAKLVMQETPNGLQAIDPDGIEGIYYINTIYRKVLAQPTYA